MQQLLYDLPLCLLITGCLCETLLSEGLPRPRDLQVGVTTGLSVGYTISLTTSAVPSPLQATTCPLCVDGSLRQPAARRTSTTLSNGLQRRQYIQHRRH